MFGFSVQINDGDQMVSPQTDDTRGAPLPPPSDATESAGSVTENSRKILV